MFKRKNIPVMLLFLISIFLFALGYGKAYIRRDTFKNGIELRSAVLDVDCSTGTSNSMIVINHNNGNHIVNMSYRSCATLKIEDTVNIKFSPKHEWYFYEFDGRDESSAEDVIGSALFFGAVLIYWIWISFRTKGG